MGSSESKMISTSSVVNPEPTLKKTLFDHLQDPRSPSAGICRTPIQVGGPVSNTSAAEYPLAFSDPRSPTLGITRTPVREVIRVTVGSFARRLGTFFHTEVESPHKPSNKSVAEKSLGYEELASTEPLLTPQQPCDSGSLAEHANILNIPVIPPQKSKDDVSPFVLLDEPEVEVETEGDITLEEAEEVRESPLHKRLSMSLITCHEGATSTQVFAEVHRDDVSSPEAEVEEQQVKSGVDHLYALPAVTTEPSLSTDVDGFPVQTSFTRPEETAKQPVSKSSPPSESPSVNRPEQLQVCAGIRCPTFDPKSPSQVVFQPQWLGKGFGASGLKSRGGSSPLAVRVAMKNATNENKGLSGKLKQRGTEGRSPLQILKETNSPQDLRSKGKLKVSTPVKRPGQVDQRMLAMSLDKENR